MEDELKIDSETGKKSFLSLARRVTSSSSLGRRRMSQSNITYFPLGLSTVDSKMSIVNYLFKNI